MIRSTVLVASTLALLLLLTGCGGGGGSSSSGAGGQAASSSAGSASASAGSTGGAASQQEGETVAVTKNPELGKILADEDGKTLYLFEKDESGEPTCSGACAQAWPPVTTEGKPQAGKGVSASKLGTITRKDGSTQVTYNGHPLYYYASDDQPGDAKGQGLEQFGAEWYVLSPNGNKVEQEDSGGESGNSHGGGGY